VLGESINRAPFREGLLSTHEEDGLWPKIAQDEWREAAFQLCWRQHGGSGLGISWSEADDILVSDRQWLLERIGEQRAQEARDIERAGKGRK
jgi:hypothetical protein